MKHHTNQKYKLNKTITSKFNDMNRQYEVLLDTYRWLNQDLSSDDFKDKEFYISEFQLHNSHYEMYDYPNFYIQSSTLFLTQHDPKKYLNKTFHYEGYLSSDMTILLIIPCDQTKKGIIELVPTNYYSKKYKTIDVFKLHNKRSISKYHPVIKSSLNQIYPNIKIICDVLYKTDTEYLIKIEKEMYDLKIKMSKVLESKFQVCFPNIYYQDISNIINNFLFNHK